MKLKIKRLKPNAVTPRIATDGSAGFDLVCTRVDRDLLRGSSPFEYVTTVHTDIAVEIPKGYVGLLFPRSSVVKTKSMLANSVGVIDSDYRGEITAVFYHNYFDGPYMPGYRCCQLVIVPIPEIEIEAVDKLSDTERGTGGYGSTGK